MFYWNQDKEHRFAQNLIEEKCDFSPIYLKGLKLGKPSRFLVFDLCKIIKKSNPEIVITPEFQIITLQLIIIRIFLNKKFKLISLCDDSLTMIENNHCLISLHSLGRKLLMPFMDEIILLDYDSYEWYRKKYNKGVWIPIIRDEVIERNSINRLIPTSNSLIKNNCLINKKVILYVGRLVAVKNLQSLLLAVSNLQREDFVVIIIGSGPELKNLLKLSFSLKINNKVKFLGRIEGEELKAWYNIANLFVLPSIHEPFGAVVNEALLAGVYCIVSNVAGSRCLINNDVNGETFNPSDIKELSLILDKWLAKVYPLSNNLEMRPNLMFVTFDQMMSKLKNVLIKYDS